MTPKQKAVVLDAAQEMQVNETWWERFEWLQNSLKWVPCTLEFNPLNVHASYYVFRRKPRTITVTIPVPVNGWAMGNERITLLFKDETDRDTTLAAIRGAMGNE